LIKRLPLAFLHEDDLGSRSNLRPYEAVAAFLVGGTPGWVIQITSSLINIVALLAVFLTLFALISAGAEILARMQNRYGPNRVGPFGLFQPIADGIKMLIKEDIVPARADKVVHFLAPVVLAAIAILTLGVIPYGRNMAPFAINGAYSFSSP